MRREMKHGRAIVSSEPRSSLRGFPLTIVAPRATPRAATQGARRFDAAGPTAAPARRAWGIAAALLIAAALTLALVPWPTLRSALSLGLALAAAAVVLRERGAGPARPTGRGLVLERDRLAFRSAALTQPILAMGAPFGVTLLATADRGHVVAVLSSASGTFNVGARLDGRRARKAAERAARLLDRAATVAADDPAVAAVAPDGEPLLLTPDAFVALIDALVAASPACLDRFVLTDVRGAAVMLDDRALSAGERSIDLTAPLEWRALIFQESFGYAAAFYQGTWIRQGGTEVVLVSLLPSFGAHGSEHDALDVGALRSQRLMQGAPEPPPPPEQRVAIDRLFMLPLRCALDRAPRSSKQPSVARA